MQIDPTKIDELLRLVAEKKLDADSAARSLLGTNSAPDRESMQSLVHRLGPPPPEVEEDWKRQIGSIARSWQARENRPLPPLTLADWFVDAENRVSLSPQITPIGDLANPTPQSTEPSPEPSPELMAEPSPAAPAIMNPSQPAKRSQVGRRNRNRWPVVAVSVAVAGVILLLVLINSGRNEPIDSSLASEQTTASPPQSRSPSPFDPGFIDQPQPAAEDSSDLQAGVMAMADVGPSIDHPSTPPPSKPDFGFDNPLLSGFTSDFSQPAAAATDSAENGSASDPPTTLLPPDRPTNTEPDTDWDAVAADQPEADGSTIQDQPVESAAPRQAVTLPAFRAATSINDFTVIGVSPLRQAEWDFPTQTNLQFTISQNSVEENSGEQRQHWKWIDATSDTELATLQQVDQQVLFRWSEHAAASPLSRQLAAGRLRLTDTTGQSATVFLRPNLRTSPLRLDAAEADARFSWPLEGPAIYQSPNLSLEVIKPDNVDMTWIEPPDTTNIRKQIATLQWTPSGKPSPVIRCRIECKASTKLQMRLRYFAQLDSTFPWQAYSATQLTLALDQVTQLLERRTAELSQIENQYRNATTSEKRSIRPVKENIEQAVTQLRIVLQKLQQLNILHSAIAATSHLQLSLTTQWPDGPQTILEIPLPDK